MDLVDDKLNICDLLFSTPPSNTLIHPHIRPHHIFLRLRFRVQGWLRSNVSHAHSERGILFVIAMFTPSGPPVDSRPLQLDHSPLTSLEWGQYGLFTLIGFQYIPWGGMGIRLISTRLSHTTV